MMESKTILRILGGLHLTVGLVLVLPLSFASVFFFTMIRFEGFPLTSYPDVINLLNGIILAPLISFLLIITGYGLLRLKKWLPKFYFLQYIAIIIFALIFTVSTLPEIFEEYRTFYIIGGLLLVIFVMSITIGIPHFTYRFIKKHSDFFIGGGAF